jgi:hypothetical protein
LICLLITSLYDIANLTLQVGAAAPKTILLRRAPQARSSEMVPIAGRQLVRPVF